jgi:ankyrin repeat protein
VKDRSLLDIAIKFQHHHLVSQLLTPDFLVSAQDCYRALAHAVETGDAAVMTQVYSVISEIEQATQIPGFSMDFESDCHELFFYTCSKGNPEVVRWFIASVPNLDLNNALSAAWYAGDRDIVDILIQAGADRHLEPDGSFFLEIVHAFDGDDPQPLLDLLVGTGAWYDATSLEFWECMGMAASVPFLRRLVVEAGDAMGEELMAAAVAGACGEGRLETVMYLLEVAVECDIDVIVGAFCDDALKSGNRELAEAIFERFYDVRNYHDLVDLHDLLMHAAACGSLTVVDKLLGFDGEHNFFECSLSAALGAASDPDVINRLLDAKASVNPPGRVAVLRGACEKLRPDGVRALLAAGADVNRWGAGEPALHQAVFAECPEDRVGDKIAVINVLLDAGARVLDDRGGATIFFTADGRATLFHYARDISLVFPVIHTLLEREPGLVLHRDYNGVTVLAAVVRNSTKHLGMVRALLDAGADPLARGSDGKSVLQYLFLGEHSNEVERIVDMCEIMRILLSAGADPTDCLRDGETLLMRVLTLSDNYSFTEGACSTVLGCILDGTATRPAVGGQE